MRIPIFTYSSLTVSGVLRANVIHSVFAMRSSVRLSHSASLTQLRAETNAISRLTA